MASGAHASGAHASGARQGTVPDWEALPEELRRNQVRFREVLDDGVGVLWTKGGNGSRGEPFTYRLGV